MTMTDHILNAAAQHYGWAAEDIRGQSRVQSLMLARHTAIYCMRHGLHYKHREICAKVNRDRSTIIASLRASEDLLKYNPGFKRAQEQIWADAVKAYAQTQEVAP